MAQYHGEDGWMSNSKMNGFRDKGPNGFRDEYVLKTRQRKETEALLFGRAFDEYFFGTPKTFAEQFVFKPEGMDFKSQKNKDWRDELLNQGISILDFKWEETFKRMKHAIETHPGASELLKEGEAQVSIRNRFTRWPSFGVQTRPDWLNVKGSEITSGLPYLVDLKTTLDYREWFDEFDPGNPRAGRAVWKHGYHRQAGLAQMLLAQEDEIRAVSPEGVTVQFLLVVEKDWPFRVGVFKLHPKTLDMGLGEMEHLLDLVNSCYVANKWPNGYQEPVIDLPEPTQFKEDEYARTTVDPSL
jgi:hypothetical protein